MTDEQLLREALAEIRELKRMVLQLQADRNPRVVGLTEACRILDIGRTTMTKRLQQGFYPFAYQENGRWKMPVNELYRCRI